MAKQEAAPRLLLWVDAVGGFLVCLGEEVELGQAVPDTTVDVPIFGDLSRRHAKIRREGEGYLIESDHRLRLDGRAAKSAGLLEDGTEIELGDSVRLRFRKPHALSATARLDFISHHRTHPSVDAVLLMAESCVLGPRLDNHVVCRGWSGDVVLYRQGRGLYCRATEPVEIDGALCEERGPITHNSRISGSDFAICLEQINNRR